MYDFECLKRSSEHILYGRTLFPSVLFFVVSFRIFCTVSLADWLKMTIFTSNFHCAESDLRSFLPPVISFQFYRIVLALCSINNEFESKVTQKWCFSKGIIESKHVVVFCYLDRKEKKTSGSHDFENEKPCAIMLKLIGLPIPGVCITYAFCLLPSI